MRLASVELALLPLSGVDAYAETCVSAKRLDDSLMLQNRYGPFVTRDFGEKLQRQRYPP